MDFGGSRVTDFQFDLFGGMGVEVIIQWNFVGRWILMENGVDFRLYEPIFWWDSEILSCLCIPNMSEYKGGEVPLREDRRIVDLVLNHWPFQKLTCNYLR